MHVINGLPAHILIIHFVVVGVPLAALLTILSALWPAARRRLGVITPVVAGLALISVPLATNAGDWLKQRVFNNALVEAHAQLGDGLLVWSIGVFVAALLAWGLPALASRTSNESLQAGWIQFVVGALAVALSVVSVVQVVRIGDSGAKAAWNGVVCAQPYTNGACPNNNFLK